VAFVVAPFVVPFVFSMPALVTGHAQDYLTTLVVFSIYGLPIAYLFQLLLGVPAWLVFRFYRVQSLFAFVAGGAVIGLLVDLILKVWSGTLKEWDAVTDPLFVLGRRVQPSCFG
jgi:hypothetical protein